MLILETQENAYSWIAAILFVKPAEVASVPPLRLLRPDAPALVAMDAMNRVMARVERDNRVVMVRVKLTDLDVGYTKNKGFERREPSERRINTFVKTYQHTDDAEKTIMILRAATTTPLLLAGAMIRLRDSFLFLHLTCRIGII